MQNTFAICLSWFSEVKLNCYQNSQGFICERIVEIENTVSCSSSNTWGLHEGSRILMEWEFNTGRPSAWWEGEVHFIAAHHWTCHPRTAQSGFQRWVFQSSEKDAPAVYVWASSRNLEGFGYSLHNMGYFTEETTRDTEGKKAPAKLKHEADIMVSPAKSNHEVDKAVSWPKPEVDIV